MSATNDNESVETDDGDVIGQEFRNSGNTIGGSDDVLARIDASARIDELLLQELEFDSRFASGISSGIGSKGALDDLQFIQMTGLTAPVRRPDWHSEAAKPDLDSDAPLQFAEPGVHDVDYRRDPFATGDDTIGFAEFSDDTHSAEFVPQRPPIDAESKPGRFRLPKSAIADELRAIAQEIQGEAAETDAVEPATHERTESESLEPVENFETPPALPELIAEDDHVEFEPATVEAILVEAIPLETIPVDATPVEAIPLETIPAQIEPYAEFSQTDTIPSRDAEIFARLRGPLSEPVSEDQVEPETDFVASAPVSDLDDLDAMVRRLESKLASRQVGIVDDRRDRAALEALDAETQFGEHYEVAAEPDEGELEPDYDFDVDENDATANGPEITPVASESASRPEPRFPFAPMPVASPSFDNRAHDNRAHDKRAEDEESDDSADDIPRVRQRQSKRNGFRQFALLLVALLVCAGAVAGVFYGRSYFQAHSLTNPQIAYAHANASLQDAATAPEFASASRQFLSINRANPSDSLGAESLFEAAHALALTPATPRGTAEPAYQEAIALFRQFIDQYPDHAKVGRAHTLTGRLLFLTGQYTEAAKVLGDPAHRERDPEGFLPSLRIRAASFAALNDVERAAADWHEAANLPDNRSREEDYQALADFYKRLARESTADEQRTQFHEKAVEELRRAADVPGLSLADRRSLMNRIDAETSLLAAAARASGRSVALVAPESPWHSGDETDETMQPSESRGVDATVDLTNEPAREREFHDQSF